MIRFNLAIYNPWPIAVAEMQQNYICKDWALTKNKRFEIQFTRWCRLDELFKFNLDAQLRGHDHAGINLEVGLCGFELMLNLYDYRHWDYDNETWEIDVDDSE
jgi:hypothetical protein